MFCLPGRVFRLGRPVVPGSGDLAPSFHRILNPKADLGATRKAGPGTPRMEPAQHAGAAAHAVALSGDDARARGWDPGRDPGRGE